MEFTDEQIKAITQKLDEKFPFSQGEDLTKQVYRVAIEVFIEGLKAINEVEDS